MRQRAQVRTGRRTRLAVDIDGQRARQVVEKVREAGGEAEALEADVAIEESGQRIAERVLGLWSKYDILVNNAAVFAISALRMRCARTGRG